MGFRLFEIWYDLPPLLRVAMGLALIGIAVLIFLVTDGWIQPVGIGAIGFIMLLFSKADSDDSGYNF